MAKHPTNLLRRNATEIKRYRQMLRFIPVIIGIILALLGVVYVVTVLYSRYGSFTVSVKKYDQMQYKLSLSYTPDFDTPSSRLNAKASTDITNIDGSTLPENLDNINGVHSGINYVAYTFYCKNFGEDSVNMQYELYIKNATKGIESAIRVRLYVNGEPTTYARTATDGSGAEPGTTEFYSETVIARGLIQGFENNAMAKFTVVIWLEGNDPDCLDPIIGGEFKVDMNISVAGVVAE